jgi:flagellar basal body-associated protein FliL
MPESQWLSHHGKRKNYLWLAVLIAAVLIAAGIFIRNNSDVLGVSHGQKKEPQATAAPVKLPESAPAPVREPAAVPAPVKESAPTPAPAPVIQPQPKTPVPVKKTPQQQPAAPVGTAMPASGVNESVPLDRITCRLQDKSQPSIIVSLLLSFPPNSELKQEILVKRDNLKVMVKKTLATKSLDDMVVDSLRRDLKSGLNSVLENGAITDIEFKEFRIEKVD